MTEQQLAEAFITLLREKDRGLLTPEDYEYRLLILDIERDKLIAQEGSEKS